MKFDKTLPGHLCVGKAGLVLPLLFFTTQVSITKVNYIIMTLRKKKWFQPPGREFIFSLVSVFLIALTVGFFIAL